MRLDLRKIWIVATTEFGSSVRSKSFIIGILVLPVLAGASMLLQFALTQRVDTRPRAIAVIDRTGVLSRSMELAAEAYNAQTVDERGKAVRPRITVEVVESKPGAQGDAAVKLDLSDRIRRGELHAFVVIPEGAALLPDSMAARPPVVDFHSDNFNDDLLLKWLSACAASAVRSRRLATSGIDQAIADRIDQPPVVDNLGIFERDTLAGEGILAIKPAQKIDRFRTMAVPAIMMFAMFFVILTSSPQLANSVLEEKMSKISEVLLGSVRPFELMMGKLLGNAGVTVLLAVVYLIIGYAVAAYYGYADMVSSGLVLRFACFCCWRSSCMDPCTWPSERRATSSRMLNRS